MTDAAPTEPVNRPSAAGRGSRRLRQLPKLAASAAVLVGSGYVAHQGVPSWEVTLFEWIHHVPRFVDYVVWLPMQAGSAWAPPVVALVAWRLTRSWRPTVGALVTGWGGWWLAKVVKNAVERGRPSAELPDGIVRL